MVQITFHFPPGEDEEGIITQAEQLQQQIKDTGVLRSVTGDIITEFSKEQGNFVISEIHYSGKMILFPLVLINFIFIRFLWIR